MKTHPNTTQFCCGTNLLDKLPDAGIAERRPLEAAVFLKNLDNVASLQTLEGLFTEHEDLPSRHAVAPHVALGCDKEKRGQGTV
jgi:hypothetical protein